MARVITSTVGPVKKNQAKKIDPDQGDTNRDDSFYDNNSCDDSFCDYDCSCDDITCDNFLDCSPDNHADARILRAAAYCRVSTLSEEQDGSFETQVKAFEDEINASPKLTLVKIYGDHGISGGNVRRRRQFQEMIQDCRDGKIDIILTKSISRFARNLSDTLRYVQELKNLGIPIWFEKESINSMDPSMDLLLGMLSAVAQEELNDLSRNVKWSIDKGDSEGNPKTSATYGYRKCMQEDKCTWKICEPESRRVCCAFQMAAEGKKYWEILECLQQMEDEEGTGVQWTNQRLWYLLHHEAYTGDLIAGKHIHVDCLTHKKVTNHGEYPQYYIEAHHEPLVSKELFEKVQENMENRVNRCNDSTQIPDRWKSQIWKRNHKWKDPDVPKTHSRGDLGCYSKTRGGKDDVRCIYGKKDCPGW